MFRRWAVLTCFFVLLSFWPADWAAKGQHEGAYLENISIKENDSDQVLDYSLKANYSGKISRVENPKMGTIRSEVEKAMEVGKEHKIYELARQLLPDCTSNHCGGHLDIKSICFFYDYLNKGDSKKKPWRYSDDPIISDSYQKAIQSFECGGTCVASGDCDDYAIAISTLIENVGGATMIMVAETNSKEKHMYSMVYLGDKSDYDNVKKITEWLNYKYSKTDIRAEFFFNRNSTYWLNLDWFGKYPGGSKPLRNPEFIRETHGPKKRMVLSNTDPVVAIDYERKLLVSEEPIWFDASRSTDADGGIRQVEWNFGDNSANSSLTNSTHIYEKPGQYKLTLKLTDNMGDINFTRIDLSIGNPRPIDIAFNPRSPKVKEEITFIAAGIKGRRNCNWSFGDEGFQQGDNLTKCTHSYKKAGRYLVNLTTADDKNMSKHNSTWIVVNDPPHAKLEWDPHLPNVKEKISFTGKASTDDQPLKTYIWQFGDGTNASGSDVSHTYDKGGSYLVSLRVMDEYDGIDDSQEIIEVNSPPSASFSFYPSSPSTDDSVKFDASLSSDPDPEGSIKAYEWDFGDKKKGSGLYPDHRYEREGNYTVRLTVIDDNELKDTTPPVIIRVNNKDVHHSPIAHINYAPEKDITIEENVIFDASWSSDEDGGILKYEWDLDDGTRSNKSSFEHRFNSTGDHTVNLTVIDEDRLNSTVSRRILVTKPRDPVASFTCNSDVFEAGKEIIFNASLSNGDNLSFKWDFGDNSPMKEGSIAKYTYPPKGYKTATYNVTLTVKDKRGKENCSSRQLRVEPARVDPLEALFVFEPKSPVAGEKVYFNATFSKGSIKRYEWNWDDGSPVGTNAVENHTFPANESVEITYQISLTLTDINDDKSRKSMNISVSPPPPPPLQPLFTFEPRDPIVGQQVIFNATPSRGTINNYLWDFGDGSGQRDDAIVTHAFTASPKRIRTYDITLTVADKKGNMFNITKQITVNPPRFPTMNSLGVETNNGMEMFHHCEIYDQVKMVANSYGGSASFTEQYPDGDERFKPYQFAYGRNEITFGADRLGEHIMGYMINGQYSNIVIIYVVEKGKINDYVSPQDTMHSAYQSLNQVNPVNLGGYYGNRSMPVQSVTSFPTHYPGQSSFVGDTHYPGQASDYLEEWLSM